MTKPNEPTLTCSEVVERLAECADIEYTKDKLGGIYTATFNRAKAAAILHSWRERPAARSVGYEGARGSRLNEAIAFAAMAHAGQVDKAGEPYILHPLRVMLRMGTAEERIVAVLHDVVEDCPDITLGEIAEKFGATIALAVDALTHEKGEPRDVYIRRVNRNTFARNVKLIDIADNLDRMQKLPPDVQERLIKKYGDALAILHSCPDFPTE